MIEYTPPKTFTESVMKKVRKEHEIQHRPFLFAEKVVSSPTMQALLAFSATCFGILNLMRIYLALFSPIICK